ncbi:MAG: methyl-accepting chemotaxis protein [Pelagimonas sp.]|jgi:methyl-accepting chemotaxis protein|nr:methyl-accepting chemotaxis protein [Pelagimonas sp.]
MQALLSLPIRVLSRVIIMSMLFSAVSVGAMSYWGASRAATSSQLLSEFERRANPTTIAKNELIQSLGYGGMIHAFKNYVLRGDEKYYRSANQNAGIALAALDRINNIEPEFAQDVEAIRSTVQAYVSATTTVKTLYAEGKAPEDIDATVKIDDSPALAAIGNLLASTGMKQDSKSSKADALASLRNQLGYGNMIHQFKNLVLRQDSARIAKVEQAIQNTRTAIDDMTQRELSVQEQQAISALSDMLDDYEAGLNQLVGLIGASHTAAEIDALVKVSDGPALAALEELDAAIALEGRQMASLMKANTEQSRVLVLWVGSALALLGVLIAWGTRELLRRGVVTKQEAADAAAAELQREREDFQEKIAVLAEAASAGDFTGRLQTDYTDDTLRHAAGQLDSMLETIETGVASVASVCHSMARGDLSNRMTGNFNGEFGKLQITLNEALTSISGLIKSVLNGSTEISDYTASISNAANDLAKRTEIQSATLQSSASNLSELTSSVKSITDKVIDARGTAESANSVAQNGSTVVNEAIEAMNRIVEASKRISKVTELIEEIAFQTNLLALNAGVEATRAGESGRGFAVVATEVQALAHRASDAVQEINNLISASEAQIEDGADRISQAGDSIKEISGYVKSLDDAIESVVTSTTHQADRLAAVNDAVSQLDNSTQQNVAMFEETAASIQSLNALTGTLLETGSQFVVEEHKAVMGEEDQKLAG